METNGFFKVTAKPLPTGSVLVKSWPDWPKGRECSLDFLRT